MSTAVAIGENPLGAPGAIALLTLIYIFEVYKVDLGGSVDICVAVRILSLMIK